MKRPTRVLALAVGVLVVAIGIVLAVQVSSDPNAARARRATVGTPIPAFTVVGLDGTPITPSTLAGRAVIVNFWNSWCVPCEQELPALRQFFDRHRDDPDLVFLGIVRDDSERAIREYVAAEEIEWTVAMDPDSDAQLGFGTRGQPETFAITPDGTIVGSQIGPATVKGLEQMLAAARGGSR